MLKPAMVALAVAAGPAMASERPISDINGPWSGEGFVQKDEKSKKVNVRCEIVGDQSSEKIGFDGECRAMLIMKRAIGADLLVEGERYSGTYVGSRLGVAELDGERVDPTTLVLRMTFPKDVNGDNTATMTIERPDEQSFTITTVDRMESGVDITTSQITFARD